ncbi:hypothetical protein A7P54_11500 [Acinetobacter sp. Ac_3412]|uniref:hypothetical protein n=1 Tax=Acinetobacter sp. Ac_3412 TaxID=1848935 RepID=UPI00148FFDEF|nr:hypothetical protein [Acinetobacter sp. Ac_3412]NNP77041.1 hypothetical protein [Acinetobacter sp. Ac_3412]
MPTSLDNYLRERVSENWQKTKEPFLLSSIGSAFNKEEIKQSTGGLTISTWIRNNLDSLELKLVSHPSQKEKIGLIPKSETFSYEDDEISINSTNLTDRELTLSFIELLQKKCTPKELEEINLPLKILVKLL